jgi:hypothetical protein
MSKKEQEQYEAGFKDALNQSSGDITKSQEYYQLLLKRKSIQAEDMEEQLRLANQKIGVLDQLNEEYYNKTFPLIRENKKQTLSSCTFPAIGIIFWAWSTISAALIYLIKNIFNL